MTKNLVLAPIIVLAFQLPLLNAAEAKGIRSLTSIHHKIVLKTQTKTSSESKPQVLYFYARWAKPCNKLEPQIKSTIQSWKHQVKFTAIDVDDHKNAALVDKYGINPIPTVIYLDELQNVVKMDIGYSNKRSITKGIKKIITHG